MTEPAPSEPTEPAKKNSGCGPLLAVVAVFAVAAWACTAAFGDDSPDETDDEHTAIAACENSVDAQLKSPASAEYSGEVARETANRVYRVTGNVDSENSFGAMIRNSWECTARPTSTGYRATATVTSE